MVTNKTIYRSCTKYSVVGDENVTAQLPIAQVNSSMVIEVAGCCSKETYLVLGVHPDSPLANAGGRGGNRNHRTAPNEAGILKEADDGETTN